MSKLFEEVTLGGVKLKNRYAMAPMGVLHDDDGGVSPMQHAYLVERAKGGFGLIYPSAHTITAKYEDPSFSGNYLYNESQAQRLAAVVEDVHKYGAKFAVQLSPGYGRVNAGYPGMTTHISASDNEVFYYPGNKCHTLTVEEIHELVSGMGKAAALAKGAGVDILELHAYGGYLIDQFLSKVWNRREDEYGGSLENRLRFLMECYQTVREAVGPDFPVSIKYTPQHEIPGGRTFEDEGIEIAKILDSMDFAFIHLDNGCYERWNRAIPAAYDIAGTQIHVAKRLREEGIKAPFLIQGKLNDPEMAEELIADGTASVIALGKQSLADPYYPSKLQSGHVEDIDFCMACGECLNSYEHGMGCAINTHCLRENESFIEPPKTTRKILVIGGGPGGMYTAKLAAKQGHSVELWEKKAYLGGNINAAGGPDFKFDMKRYNTNLQKQVYKAGVNVLLMKEATKEAVDAFAPDAVIVAAGSSPVVPPIPGVDGKNVVLVTELLTGKAQAGEKVIVLGGGEAGCEAALMLDKQGKQVTVVEMQDRILTAPMAMNSQMGLMDMINASGITFHTGTKLSKITEGKAILTGKDGDFELDCDTVVLAVGFKSNSNLAESLQGGNCKVFTIGDYNSPRKVWFANHEGYDIIRKLDELMQ